MFKFALLIIMAIILSGCAIPIINTLGYAKLAGDGVSLITTEKTLTDHALSEATGEDCAMYRIFDENSSVCIENVETDSDIYSWNDFSEE